MQFSIEDSVVALLLLLDSSVSIRSVSKCQLVHFFIQIVVGDPLDRSTGHGPQNHKAHLDKLIEYVQKAVADGAKVKIENWNF